MAVKLRLKRMGRKKRPVYAIVATDTRNPRDGRYIEDLGRYAPLDEPATVGVQEDRIHYWLDNGAQPSDTVRSLLSKTGVLLSYSMKAKGASEEDIQAAVTAHVAHRQAKAAQSAKMTPAERRAASMKAEEAVAKERAAEIAKKRAEEEAQAKADADAARKKAEADREAAAAEARKEQEEANKAQAAEEAPAADAKAEEAPAAEAKAEEAPAAEAKAEEAPVAEADAEAEESDEEKSA